MRKILENKVAIVTGAGSGIGREISLDYASNGAKVVVSDIDESMGKETVSLITQQSGTAIFVKADAAKAEDHEQLVNSTVEEFGQVDIACNNAGVANELGPFADISLNDWKKVIDINLSGVFYGMQCQIRSMLNTGGGTIINMGSTMSSIAFPGASPYIASKHGVLGITKSAALEYAQHNIRVNCVGPSFINTPMVDNAITAEQNVQLQGAHPVGRLGEVEEVAKLVTFLSSDQSPFITGGYYAIDGGYLTQ